jgi:hypothetical protein
MDELWWGGQWVNHNRDSSIFNANGWEIANLFQNWSNGQWVNSDTGTTTYDAQGREISNRQEQWSSDQWVNYDSTTYTYDANGRKTSYFYEYWSNDQWVNYLREMWTYDVHGNLTSDVRDLWHNSSWIPEDVSCSIDDGAGSWLYKGSNLTFTYRIVATGVAPEKGSIPATSSLSQNYPNPFNPTTTIRYSLPNRSHAALAVFNTLGQQVAILQNGEQDAGFHEVQFDGSRLASGVYFYRLQAGEFVHTSKMLLTK